MRLQLGPRSCRLQQAIALHLAAVHTARTLNTMQRSALLATLCHRPECTACQATEATLAEIEQLMMTNAALAFTS